jgi:hypothetical protein
VDAAMRPRLDTGNDWMTRRGAGVEAGVENAPAASSLHPSSSESAMAPPYTRSNPIPRIGHPPHRHLRACLAIELCPQLHGAPGSGSRHVRMLAVQPFSTLVSDSSVQIFRWQTFPPCARRALSRTGWATATAPPSRRCV